MNEILSLLSKNIGTFQKKSGNNYAFHCPFCNHVKNKLEINIKSYQWNCWVCGTKGRSLFALFKKVKASDETFLKLKQLIGESKYSNLLYKANIEKPNITLPKEYKPLWIKNEKDLFWKQAIEYLYSRKINLYDILKYRIGYCTSGKYKDMLIFPNYDSVGTLNYFTTRTFKRGNGKKFQNPHDSKNVIGFELQLNPDLPLIIVESALDAMVVKRNVTPLYGTILSNNLKLWIFENDVKDIYICLDPDALKYSIKYAQYFMYNGKNVYFVQMDEDPNDLGYEKMWDKINSTEKLTEEKLFDFKVKSLFI